MSKVLYIKGHGEWQDMYVVHEAVISKIEINVQNDKMYVSYRCIYDRDADLPLKEKHKETSISEYKDKIFAILEEAETRCKELNEK